MVASATVSLTANVATPDAFVTPETVVIVEEPPAFASVTVLPATGFDWASRRVTEPGGGAVRRAAGEAGDADTGDWSAAAAPAANCTEAVWPTVTPSVVSCAV